MPQETNLNVNPYFDDFDKNNNHYKVLFKPGAPVQARELSTLQSILQNQIEQFGTHFFKEGSKVIPGNTTYDNNYTCVQIESSFLGIPVSLYTDKLLGLKITGARSGVTATVRKVLLEDDSERGNLTLYIKYVQSGSDNETSVFEDGESLLTGSDIVYGSSVIAANEPFANTLISDSISSGSAFSVGEGVYFIRGTFSQVQSETLILAQYSQDPSFRIGFNVPRRFVTADEDPSLNDNAAGFTNFAAPGADRFRITINLTKKELNDYNDQNFVEIARIEEGNVQTFVKDTQYNLINDTLARRTFEESGDYYVKPFAIHVRECLDDGIGSDGIFNEEQLTAQGNTPSDDLLTIKLSPGTAYVKGYRIDKLSSTFLDVPKPRTTREIEQESVTYSTGDPILVNNIFGSPSLGIGTTATIALMNRRRGNSGTEIGLARLYDFKAQSGSFKDATTQYELRLFDVKTFTNVTVGTAITSLSATDRIQGSRSGAVGYVKTSGTNVSTISLTDVTGKFLKNESLIINGNSDGRVIKKVDTFGINDIASVESAVGVSTFAADVVLDSGQKLTNLASGNLQLNYVSGDATSTTGSITAAGQNFAGIITTNNIVSYTIPGETVPRFNRITGVSVSGDSINIVGIPTVSGVCNGGVENQSALAVNDLILRSPSFEIGDNTFLTPVNHPYVESLDVTNTTLQIRKQYTDITVSGNQFTTPDAGKDLFFQPFAEDRYFISYDEGGGNYGSVEPLTSDQVKIADDKKTVTFVALSIASGKANLFATVLKTKTVNKQKKLNEANVLIIDRSSDSSSGVGTNTSNDGLSFHRAFGTRVQDKKICLNVPDAVQLLGVFESNDNNEPDLPSITLTGFDGPSGTNADFIVGEKLTGLDEGAVVAIIEKSGTDSVGVVNLNEEDFDIGEVVKGSKSGVTATVTAVLTGDRDITDYYELNTGLKPTYYDYSSIERSKDLSEPERKLKIVFKNFFVEESDTGDFYTASSYPTGSRPLITADPDYEQLLTDLIDLRPRVANYDPSASSSSPFTHSSRSFTTNGDGSLNPLVSEESLIVNYNYYLGRHDKLFLDRNGDFLYVQGVPSEKLLPPRANGDALEVANIILPPYTTDATEAFVERSKHKRFTMADIGRLEKRVENVEYYTRLSLLELDASTLEVTDANGLNRFKCGFFVDNFKRHDAHQIAHPDFSASTDAGEGYLRPGHFTTCIDLVPASKSKFGLEGVPKDKKADLKYVNDISGTNNRKTLNAITLDYEEVVMIEQVYASRVENVNPYLIAYYDGDVMLVPDSDTWMDTKKIDASIIYDTTEYDKMVKKYGINEKTGLSEVDWKKWEEVWSGEKVLDTYTETTKEKIDKISPKKAKKLGAKLDIKKIANKKMTVKINGKWTSKKNALITKGVLETKQKYQDVKQTTKYSKEGLQYKLKSKTTEEVIGEKVVSTDVVPYMRKRQIEVNATGLKPLTRFYPFFDGVLMDAYSSPKLVEIEMVEGVFEVGEIIEGELDFGKKVPKFGGGQKKMKANKFKKGIKDEIVVRLCQPNHKEGPFDKPTKTYKQNPYNPSQNVPSKYSSSSTLLNIDTFSLVNMVDDEFLGRVRGGMRLIGQTSGAEAIVRGNLKKEKAAHQNRYISDEHGSLKLVLSIPDPKKKKAPKFETGVKTFRLTTSRENSEVGGTVNSHAEADFHAQGTLNTVQETILSTKVPKVKKLTVEDQKTINKVISQKVGKGKKTFKGVQYYDPLAQTFRVDEETGVFLTSVDVYFRNKDDQLPVTMQVRTVQTGFPTSEILPYSVVSKEPDEVNISEDGTVPTTFTFDSPVYVQGEQEYAFVLVTPSENYFAWISRMGEVDITTANLDASEQVIISQQPYLGSLFKSQNGTTWDASQLEDMKFVLRKAKFNVGTPGTARFFNNEISVGNNLIEPLKENGVKFISRNATVKIGTNLALESSTNFPTGLVSGVTIKQMGNEGARATVEKFAGAIAINNSGSVSIVNPGVGYTPSSDIQTYSNVPMITLTGSGSGAIADVSTDDSGRIGVVTFVNGGQNYVVGDTLGVGTIGLGNGKNDVIAVGLITAVNTLQVKNVQGTFNLGVGTITYNNGSSFVALDGVSNNVGSAATVSSFEVDPKSDGLHFKVHDRSHGMNDAGNRVAIAGIKPDTPEISLTADYGKKSTDNISVVDSSSFAEFEGVAVGATNYGYALINGTEIVSYTGVADGQITGITTRGIGPRPNRYGRGGGQTSSKKSHDEGAIIQKYEMAGVSLRRINCIHNLNDVDVVTYPLGLDDYFIKINMSSDKALNKVSPGEDRSGSGSFPALFINRTKNDGGTLISPQNNIQYEAITPNIMTTTPAGTSISAKVRTISGSSIGGSEQPFIDQGFQDIDLTGINEFDSTRTIASRTNALANLTDVTPDERSLIFELVMNSEDENISPMIDLERMAAILTTNRLSSGNFDDDGFMRRTKVTGEDPNTATYISNLVELQNPASSILLEFSAYRSEGSEIRAFYKTMEEGTSEDSFDIDFDPFPGFSNTDEFDKVIDPNKNTGQPDQNVPASVGDEFLEYRFSSREIPKFTRFQIKVVMVGNNQAKPPKIKELRGIALA